MLRFSTLQLLKTLYVSFFCIAHCSFWKHCTVYCVFLHCSFWKHFMLRFSALQLLKTLYIAFFYIAAFENILYYVVLYSAAFEKGVRCFSRHCSFWKTFALRFSMLQLFFSCFLTKLSNTYRLCTYKERDTISRSIEYTRIVIVTSEIRLF